MNDALMKQWRDLTAAALTWEAGENPAPVLEALALSSALELTGDLAHLPAGERDRLRRIGQRALLFVGAALEDEDEIEALRMSAALARDGLRALTGRPLAEESVPTIDPRWTTSPGELVRLLGGRLDGLAAGSLAIRIRRSPNALGELRALARLSTETERPIALAAADAAAVLDPAAGQVVGTLEALAAEAVLFEGEPRRLAVYSEDPAPLRLVAPELTTEDVREGYWVGRIQEGVRRIEAILHAGEHTEPWVIELSPA